MAGVNLDSHLYCPDVSNSFIAHEPLLDLIPGSRAGSTYLLDGDRGDQVADQSGFWQRSTGTKRSRNPGNGAIARTDNIYRAFHRHCRDDFCITVFQQASTAGSA